MSNKYIKCFSQDKADELSYLGFEYLYEQNGIFYFKNDDSKSKKMKFSKNNSENFSENDIVYSKTLNF